MAVRYKRCIVLRSNLRKTATQPLVLNQIKKRQLEIKSPPLKGSRSTNWGGGGGGGTNGKDPIR